MKRGFLFLTFLSLIASLAGASSGCATYHCGSLTTESRTSVDYSVEMCPQGAILMESESSNGRIKSTYESMVIRDGDTSSFVAEDNRATLSNGTVLLEIGHVASLDCNR